MKFLKSIIFAILTWESRLILAKYKPFIVAVTGSVGKTSTKDAIFSVLKDRNRYVRKSEKSFNSMPGLPLTVIGAPNAWRSLSGWMKNIMSGAKLIFKKNEYPDCLVLEVGADHPNDIKSIVKWLRPDISVITQVSDTPVHVEFFASPLEVFEEKASLAMAVKDGGTLVLFADNPYIMELTERVKDRGIKIISFGTVESANVKGSDQKTSYSGGVNGTNGTSGAPTGFAFKITFPKESAEIGVHGLLGSTYMYPLLAAAAVGVAKNVPTTSIVNGLNSYSAPKGRMNIIAGMNGTTIIDDTYNSSPDAVASALKTLKSLESTGAKIAVLGDMMELGQYSAEEHRNVGKQVAESVTELVTVGQRSRATADEAVKSGLDVTKVHSFDDSVQAGDYLKSILKSGDIALIKGSQSMRMEKAVAMLMAQPEQASELLVRQEKEWLEKK